MTVYSAGIATQYDAASALAADQRLASEIAAGLSRHYAGWAWAVNVDSRPEVGMVTIENWDLSIANGFRFKIKDLQTPDQVRRTAILAGGEFLERFNLPRAKANAADKAEHSARAIFQ
jgi:hypothetical protein